MDVQVVPTFRPDYTTHELRKSIKSNELLIEMVIASLEIIRKRLDKLEQIDDQRRTQC